MDDISTYYVSWFIENKDGICQVILRINAEIRDNRIGYVEFNTAVEKDGNKEFCDCTFAWHFSENDANGKRPVKWTFPVQRR